jgi:hypothetical protein
MSDEAQAEVKSLTERFGSYFDRNVAQVAAKSISNGAEVQFHVGDEIFTFTKQSGKNEVLPEAATDPQLIFTMSAQAAEEILGFQSTEIGEIGVHIAKMVVAKDSNRHIKVQFKTGFFGLFTKGYLGVLTVGGSHFASFLASQGLNGIGAIKSLLGKIK